ncbi:MAG: DUF1232 domain-containing protein [Proteobacteria bacterium]|nr:MAG: DUF1232 domain-containing protein [Pseudomonadota bacterium]
MLKFVNQARRLLRNPKEILPILADGLSKAYSRRLLLVNVFFDFLIMFRMVKAWTLGEFKKSPKQSILWALAAIIYFVSPIDAIPDFLPGGYLDDIAFISFIVARIRPNLDEFLAWEKAKKEKGEK